MAPMNEITFKCIIKSADPKDPHHVHVDLQHRNSRLLAVFISKVRLEYELTGEITVWRSKVDSTGRLVCGQRIRDLKLVLTENETLFVLYDKTVEVIPGGVGTGARGYKGLAQGGLGTGGSLINGHKAGGDGVGGSLIGEKATGKGGDGWGGQVENGDAGDGAGGEIRKRDPILTAG